MSIPRSDQLVLNAHMALIGSTPGHGMFHSHAAIARAAGGEAAWIGAVNSFVNATFAGPDGSARLADAVIANLGLGAIAGIRELAIGFFNSQPANRGALAIAAADWLLQSPFGAGDTALLAAQAALRATQNAAFAHSNNPANLAAAPTTPGSALASGQPDPQAALNAASVAARAAYEAAAATAAASLAAAQAAQAASDTAQAAVTNLASANAFRTAAQAAQTAAATALADATAAVTAAAAFTSAAAATTDGADNVVAAAAAAAAAAGRSAAQGVQTAASADVTAAAAEVERFSPATPANITLSAPNAVVTPTQAVNANAKTTALDDTIQTTAANLSGSTITGGAGNDTLKLTTAATLNLNDGKAGGTVTQVETLTLAAGTNNISFTAGTGIKHVVGNSGADTINSAHLSSGGMVFLFDGNDTYNIQANHPDTFVNLGPGDDSIVSTVGGTVTVVISGDAGTDTLFLRHNDNISGSIISDVEQLSIANNSLVVMTAEQHKAFQQIQANGAGDFVVLVTSGVTVGAAAVEGYVLRGIAANDFTLGFKGQSVSASNQADTVRIGAFDFNGNLNAFNAADTLVASHGAKINNAVDANFQNPGLSLGFGTLNLSGTITMTVAQHQGFTTIAATGANDHVILANAGSVVAKAEVESYTLGNGVNSFTFATTPAGAAQSVSTTGTGADTINITLADTGNRVFNVTLAADAAVDRISAWNASQNPAHQNTFNVIGFTPANDAVNIGIGDGGHTISHGSSFQSIAAGSNTDLKVAMHSVVEIEGSNIANLAATADGSTVEQAIMAAVRHMRLGTYTFVLYSGADAGIYSVSLTTPLDFPHPTQDLGLASEFSVELLGILRGVGANALTNLNFY